MCGIVGFALYGSSAPASDYVPALQRASGALQTRGPDSQGLWNDDHVAFAHRRLSVLDLTESGAQPMFSADRRYMITYNGEIYNFQDLRAELERTGIRFRSSCDTEVLIEGFAQWGHERLLRRLNGMFAFAIWDFKTRKLFLARDRFGVKPLLYVHRPRVFAFGSTLASLLELPFADRKLNPLAISYYLQALCVPSFCSIYEGVEKVPPGSWMVVDENGAISRGTYWEPCFVERNVTEDQYIEEFDALLDAAVKRRLVSDVPVGIFLSGGIDSSLVASYATRYQPNIQSFTIHFDDAEFNEADTASQISRHLGTHHHESRLNAQALLDRVSHLARAYDEPFADASAIPTLLLSEATRRYVTVALSGDGGDELFGGYPYYGWVAALRPIFRNVPHRLRAWGAWAARLRQMPLPYRARLLSKALSRPGLPEAFAYMRGPLKEAELGRLLSFGHPALIEDAYAEFMRGHEFDAGYYGYLDFRNYLVDDILVKVDRASMAYSLEVRNPFMDVNVVDWALGVPFDLKLRGRTTKYLSRRLLARYLPESFTKLPKRGFSVPIRRWFRGELRKEIEGLASHTWTDCLIEPDYVAQLVGENQSGERNHDSLLWALWNLRLWYEQNK